MRLQVELIRRYVTALGIALAVLAVDLYTKRLASIHFSNNPVDVIPGFLSFTFTENPGGAFSLFPNAGPLLGVAAIGVSAIVVWALRIDRPILEIVAFGFVLGGALGNLTDRLARGEGLLDGKVVDWINLWWIPTFNIADASVTIAVGLLAIHAWRAE